MDTLSGFTCKLYELLREKMGSRFKGYMLVNNDYGLIEGVIDGKSIDMKCYQKTVNYIIGHYNASYLRDELDAIIEELIGKDNIKSHAENHSWAGNSLGSIFLLNYELNSIKESEQRKSR